MKVSQLLPNRHLQVSRPFNSLVRVSGSIAFTLATLSFGTLSVRAEGSRNLYPTGTTGNRANIEWRSSSYGATTPVDNSLKRRTLLRVYANSGEYIFLGSSAVGVTMNPTTATNNADIRIYHPGTVTGRVGNETIPATPNYSCRTQRASTANTNQGRITNRNQELAGPDGISNALTATPSGTVTNGYVPCFYQAPSNGVYSVVFYGPSGDNSNGQATLNGNLDPAVSQTNTPTSTDIAAWDVTVRSSLNSTTDITGRLFTRYLAAFTGANSRPINSTVYIVTKDGYKYETIFRGLDPNGFVFYANDVGFYDSDLITPLYHDIVAGGAGNLDQLQSLVGNTVIALPTHFMFFSNPTNATGVTDTLISQTIPLSPTAPAISNVVFNGTAGSNNSTINTGGTFSFSSNIPGNYEIIISSDGINFDPTNPLNRRLVGVMTTAGTISVAWNGRRNNGTFFPVGTYSSTISVRGGEYHFPLLDTENSSNGGPTIKLLNPPGACPVIASCQGAYFDDRSYTTAGGTAVNTNLTNYSGSPGAFGIYDSGSTNRSFTGGGDKKGLDIWAYYSVTSPLVSVVIVNAGNGDLQITKTRSASFPVNGTGSYTLTVTNIGTNPISGTTTVVDNLPASLTFSSVSGTGWTCNNTNPISCTRSDSLAANISFPPITINVNIGQAAIPSVTNTATLTNANDLNSDNNTATNTVNFPRLRLVKRITRVNNTVFNDLLDNPSDVNDDSTLNWPISYLRGKTGQGINSTDVVFVLPGDIVEYTIYFLSDGEIGSDNITACDLVPLNNTFVPSGFNSVPAAPGGFSGNRGIDIVFNGTERSYTNAVDGDSGQFYLVNNTLVPVPSGATSPAPCPNSNTAANGNGAVVVNLGNLPRATTPGSPSNAYGLFRFRARVN